MEDRYTTPGTVLRDEKTREIIKKGQKVKSFRGETMTVLGWQTHGPSSTGRVLVKWGGPKDNTYTQEFFPSVVGAFIDESGVE